MAHNSAFIIHYSWALPIFAIMEDEFDIREARLPESEREYENALRPLSFRDFSGQAKVVENLRGFVMAARMR